MHGPAAVLKQKRHRKEYPSDMTDIGKSIRKARKSRDVSQRRLARYIGVSQAAISYIESGENIPELATLQLIARALNVEFVISAENGTDLSAKDIQAVSLSLEDLIDRYGMQIDMSTGTVNIASGTRCRIKIPGIQERGR